MKDKLTIPQLRILKCLYEGEKAAKEESPDLSCSLTRNQIAEKAGVSKSMTGNLGPLQTDPKILEATTKHYGRKNLMHFGYVVQNTIFLDGETYEMVYSITSAGIEAYQSDERISFLSAQHESKELQLQETSDLTAEE